MNQNIHFTTFDLSEAPTPTNTNANKKKPQLLLVIAKLNNIISKKKFRICTQREEQVSKSEVFSYFFPIKYSKGQRALNQFSITNNLYPEVEDPRQLTPLSYILKLETEEKICQKSTMSEKSMGQVARAHYQTGKLQQT